MGVQLEYINHLLQFLKNISYYAGIMLNAFSDLLCSNLCWHNRLVPTSELSEVESFTIDSMIRGYTRMFGPGSFVLLKNCPTLKIFRKVLSHGIKYFVLGHKFSENFCPRTKNFRKFCPT